MINPGARDQITFGQSWQYLVGRPNANLLT